MWAPEIHFVQDGYKIYFTAMSKTTGNTRKVTVKSQLETALKYKPPLNSNRDFEVTLKIELETALEL